MCKILKTASTMEMVAIGMNTKLLHKELQRSSCDFSSKCRMTVKLHIPTHRPLGQLPHIIFT